MANNEKIIAQDLAQIFGDTQDIWPILDGMRLFMTGGTGFIGLWMLESLCCAKERLDLDIEVTVLSRSMDRFSKKAPHLLAKPYLKLLEGNVLSMVVPKGHFTHLVHAATDASAELNDNDPLLMFDSVVSGTRWALEFAREKSVKRVLYLSSGAVYGCQPWEITHLREDWHGGPDILNAKNAYAEGKRASEQLCAIYGQQYGVESVTARIFAIVGPGLPLDAHFAAGNFIRDALSGKPITVKGDGRPRRSYLYTSDLTTWLWKILGKANSGDCFNVGSAHCLSVAELAHLTNDVLDGSGVSILSAPDVGWNAGRYVPSVDKITRELGVSEKISIAEAIRRTGAYNGSVISKNL